MRKFITFNFKFLGENYKGRFVFSHYLDNETFFIGIEVYNEEYQYWESWDDVTTNLGLLYYNDITTIYIEENFGLKPQYSKNLIDLMKRIGIIENRITSPMKFNFNRYIGYKINPTVLSKLAKNLEQAE